MTNTQLASAWRRELNHAAAHAQTDYPDPQGLRELREQVCGYLARRRGIVAAPEDVLIVSGTQQAFSSDSKWLAASIGVSEADQEKLRKARKPLHRKLALLKLSTTELTTIDGIESFAFSQR